MDGQLIGDSSHACVHDQTCNFSCIMTIIVAALVPSGIGGADVSTFHVSVYTFLLERRHGVAALVKSGRGGLS